MRDKVSANESKSKMKDVVFRFAFAECSLNLLKVSARRAVSKIKKGFLGCLPEPQPNLRRQAKVSANESKGKMKDIGKTKSLWTKTPQAHPYTY